MRGSYHSFNRKINSSLPSGTTEYPRGSGDSRSAKDAFLPMKMYETKKGVTADHILWDIAAQLLQNGNMVRFRAPGVSMTPFIRHRESITIKPCSHQDIKFGDIILYTGFGNGPRGLSYPLGDRKIVHRFLGRREVDGELRLFSKGDNNYLCDPPVCPHQVLGKVVEIQKNGWRLRFDSPSGRLLNILCGLTMIPPFSFFSFSCMKKVKWVYHRIRKEPKPPHDDIQENQRLES